MRLFCYLEESGYIRVGGFRKITGFVLVIPHMGCALFR